MSQSEALNAKTSFRCNRRMLEALTILAEAVNLKSSNIIREAVEQFIERNWQEQIGGGRP